MNGEYRYTLDEHDVKWCEDFVRYKEQARNRVIESRGRKIKNYDAYDPAKKFEYELMAVKGEYVASKVLGVRMIIEYDLILKGAADLEFNIEVRTVQQVGYGLLFNQRSQEGRAFVLVALEGNTGELRGWRRWNTETLNLCQQKEYNKPNRNGQVLYRLPDIHLLTMSSMVTRLNELKALCNYC